MDLYMLPGEALPRGSAWTKDKLVLVREALLATKKALEGVGVLNWREEIGDVKFYHKAGNKLDAFFWPEASGSSMHGIVLNSGVFWGDPLEAIFTIAHEIGHAIDFHRNGWASVDRTATLGRELLSRTGAGRFSRANGNCFRAYACSRSNEAWADAFAVFVVDQGDPLETTWDVGAVVPGLTFYHDSLWGYEMNYGVVSNAVAGIVGRWRIGH
ncbi:MAG: ImmA/IrrE family metallo-endopeptidase [Nitrososphaera sp.]|nr:ImmA/IrrE family metallo-endopeptidase [Nitrososphaera sp.]